LLCGPSTVLTARTTRRVGTVDSLASIEFGVAATFPERERAFRLVHDQYVARGYMRPDPAGRRIGRHHALPATRVFVARVLDEIVATVSVVPDSPAGLPCDDLYQMELTPIRARHARLAEVSALAVHDDWRDIGLLIVRGLVQAIALYAHRLAGLETLCITVNPRHVRFYETCLMFKRFGGVKSYAAVNGALAVALSLDLAREMRAPLIASAVPFAAGLFEGDVDRALTTIRRDLERADNVQSFQSVASDLAGQRSMEVC
jgi:GNAT superfamily N-acetyltransferase